MVTRHGLSSTGKLLVVVLTLWALLVVMPDAVRIVRPLGTLGFSADNDGYVASVVQGGPAAKAGIAVGDRIALDKMSCIVSVSECKQLLSVFGGMGGMQYVRPGHPVTLWLRTPDQQPRDPPRLHEKIMPIPETREKTAGEQELWRIALGADELGALAFILCSTWLFWRRPCTMTAGFFMYALWFNPGQYFEFYSWLQGSPVAMLVQETLQAIFQSIGYVGFLVLALYFPNNVTRPRLRWINPLLPWIAAVLAVLQLASFLNIFGVGTETVTRASYIAGWSLVGAVLVYVLPTVLLDQRPEEKARTKWLLTGCVVGISSFIFADFNEATTMSPWSLPEAITDFLFFLNVITLVVVIYTVRHYRVVNLGFALTRGLERLGLWALVTAVGAFLIHKFDKHLGEDVHWDDVAVSLALIGATLAWERIQEVLTDLLDRVFFPNFHRAIRELEHIARRITDFTSITHVERSLVHKAARELNVSSAALFRRRREAFRRCAAAGWPHHALIEIEHRSPLVVDRIKDSERAIRLRDADWASGQLPEGVALPTVAVPIRAFGRLHAVVLYGAHHRGDDLNNEEVAALDNLARCAALAYEAIEAAALRRQVRALTRTTTTPKAMSTAPPPVPHRVPAPSVT